MVKKKKDVITIKTSLNDNAQHFRDATGKSIQEYEYVEYMTPDFVFGDDL